MPIVNMLELSTAHLTEETRDILERTSSTDELPIVVYDKEIYGWFIPVTETMQEKDVMNQLPRDLLYICAYALAKGVNWIMFDCDAEQDLELPVYE